MIFTPTEVAGAFVIDLERHEDERGFFARIFCAEEFERRGLDARVAQVSLSHTSSRGTLRGLHFQRPPHGETKLVRCLRGSAHDVILDLRPESETYLKHATVELTAENRRSIYVPRGCAHGFQALQDETELLYQMSIAYAPEAQAGVRWNDPAFGIEWPIVPPTVNERDAGYPAYQSDPSR